MTPEELARALLAAGDAAARRALLGPQDAAFYVRVAAWLKDEVDRERLHDPGAALKIAAIAGEAARFAAVPECQALADWARGNVLIHLGYYEETLQLYQQAARILVAQGADLEVARLTANQSFVLRNLGRYEEGLEAAQAALKSLRQQPPSPFLASVLTGMGALYRSLRRYDDALAAYAESEQLYTTFGDEVRRARVVLNQANVLENLDRFGEAQVLLEQARAVLSTHGQSLEVARADLNLGILATRLGRYDEALDALDRAGKGFAALDNAMEVAVVDLYRADLYAEFNLYEDLLRISAYDWQLFDERQMQWQAARATLHQVVGYRRLGHPLQAGELLDKAEAAFVRLGDAVWMRLAALERAVLWAELGEWARALPVALEAGAFFEGRGIPLRAASSYLLAAQSYLALGRLPEAAERYQQVLTLAGALDVPSLVYRARHGLGQIAERQGRLEEAHQHLSQAADLLESLRQRLRVEDFRLGFLEDKLQVYHDAVLLCLRLGRDDEAFSYVERFKSGALVDLLISSPPVKGPASGDLMARLKKLREELNWRYSSHENDGEESATRSQTRAYALAAEQQAVQLWRELQQASPFYQQLVQPDRCRPAALRESLRGDDVLLQYFTAGDGVYVFVVGPEGLRTWVRLACSATQVEQAVSALEMGLRSVPAFDPDYVSRVLDRLCRQQLGWLYAELLLPLAALWQGAGRLLIAPDGVLFGVPFQALHDGESYLLEGREIAYTPSAGALRLCQENYCRRRAAPGKALIMGYSRGGQLAHLWKEAEAVARTIPGARAFVDEEATLARLYEHSPSSALVHLATHAVFRHDNPLFSALQLAGGDWLRAMDLYSLGLDGALVALSSCETGRQRLLGGDVVGLSRGFLYAGASALLVSLWPVEDASTAQLMARFYTGLASGETAAAALRRAQLALYSLVEERDGGPVHPYAHPFYWAPFCLMGAPDVRLTCDLT